MRNQFVLCIAQIFCTLASVLANNIFAVECRNWHNIYRDMHSAPRLRLDDALQKSAEEYAKTLALNHLGATYNRTGENIYLRSITEEDSNYARPKLAVDYWYKEKKNYDYSRPGFSENTRGFTQLVWESSHKLGCAYFNTYDVIYMVAHYSPPGNVRGQFEENVLPLEEAYENCKK